MSGLSDDIGQRASLYVERRRLELDRQLGDGKDGTVFSTRYPAGKATAVKVFQRPDMYARELAVYQRHREHEVIDIYGHSVPQLIA